VAEIFGLHLAGFVAWFVWRGVYLFKLPTWSRRFQVGFDWALLLLFPRDLSHLRNRQTDRVTRTQYRPGEFVFKAGEPRIDFYVVEQGEVEVLRSSPEFPNGKGISVLGPGSLFGESSLLSDGLRVSSVRARTSAKVLVIGRLVFTQSCQSLNTLRDVLAHIAWVCMVEPARLPRIEVHGKLIGPARDDASLVLARDPTLASERGQALRHLLYLFERDEAIRLLRAG